MSSSVPVITYSRGVANFIGFLVLGFLVLLVVGGLTGRVKATSCCSVSTADPRRDRRMAAAFDRPTDDCDAMGGVRNSPAITRTPVEDVGATSADALRRPR